MKSKIVDLSIGESICLHTEAGPVTIRLNSTKRKWLATLGFDARREITIHRKELQDAIREGRKS